jgi:hypothetical protein
MVMADASGRWLLNVLDAASFSCILVAIEEYGRSVAHAGPTMSPQAQLGFLCTGVVLSFLGRKGPKMWHGLWDWVTRESLKQEIAKLKSELTAAKRQSVEIPVSSLQVLSLLGGRPSNAAELVWNWRRMVTNAHGAAKQEKITFAEALVRDASYPDLRPHLRESIRKEIEGLQLRPPTGVVVDPLFSQVLEDVDRIAKDWGLTTEPSDKVALTESQKQPSDEERIKITLPLPGEPLIDKQPLGPSAFSYEVRGKLKSLPQGCEIWLLTADDRAERYWPQGFRRVQYKEQTGDWQGRVHAGNSPLRVIALVAPPTSQQLFRYFQKRGDETGYHSPLDRIPEECQNIASVQTRVP